MNLPHLRAERTWTPIYRFKRVNEVEKCCSEKYLPSHLYIDWTSGLVMDYSRRPATENMLKWVRLYIEEELGINKIAEMLGRSSRTPVNADKQAQ